jgi:SAM-dependent methyltransferase
MQLDLTRKKFRSRVLKKTVDAGHSLSDVARVLPGVSYLRADDVAAVEAYDVVLMQSVTHTLADLPAILDHLHRALRPNGEIWILHENFYSWAGHLGEPRSPAQFDPANDEHVQVVDWGHVLFDAPEGHRLHTHFNRLRLRDLRRLLDTRFEIEQWKETPERASVRDRLTPERRAALKDFSESELLTRQIICRGRKRRVS